MALPADTNGAHSDDTLALYHGTTTESAASIAADGICRTFYMTPNAQVAAVYAAHRAAESGADPAIVVVRVPKALLARLRGNGSARLSCLSGVEQVVFGAGARSQLNECALAIWDERGRTERVASHGAGVRREPAGAAI